jgi:hypothetical protein
MRENVEGGALRHHAARLDGIDGLERKASPSRELLAGKAAFPA